MIFMSSSTSKDNRRWFYNGPVYDVNDCVLSFNYQAYTSAPSKEKAIANLTYKWKRHHELDVTTKVYLLEDYLKEGNGITPYKCEVSVDGPKNLYESDFDSDIWAMLCEIFGLEEAESIGLDKYILRTYGIRKEKANGS